jgi:hypothetical protein
MGPPGPKVFFGGVKIFFFSLSPPGALLSGGRGVFFVKKPPSTP